MRKLNVGANDNTEVFAVDEKDSSGGNHDYIITWSRSNDGSTASQAIQFQKGPIKEVGVNCIQNEDLLAIVIDRLQGFQNGPFKCKENGRALVDLQGALYHLHHRTRDREKRGVEGTNQI